MLSTDPQPSTHVWSSAILINLRLVADNLVSKLGPTTTSPISDTLLHRWETSDFATLNHLFRTEIMAYWMGRGHQSAHKPHLQAGIGEILVCPTDK